jgi:hypothetical protein
MAMAAGQNSAYMRGSASMPFGGPIYNIIPHGAAQMSNMAYYNNMAMVMYMCSMTREEEEEEEKGRGVCVGGVV